MCLGSRLSARSAKHSPMQLQPNTLLQGRYRVIMLLAQGGMGAVYRATDERLGNTVALKQTLMSDPQLRAAFEREARLLAGLHHPALPVVSDHFAEGGGQFLVMQFIAGDDLATLIERRGAPFPLTSVLRWADRLLDALDYLHTQSPPIIHRDIKPQNLKLTPRDEIVLLDFGLAKGEPASKLASGGKSIFGYTPQYAPLEQIQGAGTDARSDLYAVAATLYQLLTAEPPADALTRAAATVSGRPDPLRPADELCPGLPRALADLLVQALALNALGRPPSAAAMRAALHTAGSGGSSAGQATIAAVPRVPVVSSSAGLATLALPAGTAREAPQPQAIVAAPNRPRSLWLVGGAALALLVLVVVLFLPRPSSGIAPGDPPSLTSSEGAALIGVRRSEPASYAMPVRVPGWEVRVLETLRGEDAWRMMYETNGANDPAPAGYEFLMVRLDVAASFGEGEKRSFYPQATGLRRVEYNQSGSVLPEPRLPSEFRTGERANGWISFLVAQDESELLLQVDDLGSGDQTPPVYLALETGAAVPELPGLRELDPNTLGVDHREPAALGETVISEDWQLTLREVVRGDKVLELLTQEYSGFEQPAKDREYVLVRMAVHYIGAETVTGSASLGNLNFKTAPIGADDPQAAMVDAPSVYSLPAPELDLYLFPGGVVEGWAIVQLPLDGDEHVLVFTTGYDSDDLNTRYFVLE